MSGTTEKDRAIVVGVNSYPTFGLDGKSSNDLQGPVADATEMARWLADEAGAEVTLITSHGRGDEQWTVLNRRPNRQDVEDGFTAYVAESTGRPIQRLGRRLYIYMAGHGFAPERHHLALITANALGDTSLPNVQATSWIDWFADQLYFDELVLWMDCCATRTFSYDGGKPLMKKAAARASGQAKVFSAFAARPTLSAFEGPVGPGGAVRGLFTDMLLRGLRGAAVAPDGFVRTSSLVNYFYNQKALVGQGVVGNAAALPAVDPDFRDTDELVFTRINTYPDYTLRTGLPDGAPLRVIASDSLGRLAVVAGGQVKDGAVTVRLAPGYYKAVAPGFGQVFEVAAGTVGEIPLA